MLKLNLSEGVGTALSSSGMHNFVKGRESVHRSSQRQRDLFFKWYKTPNNIQHCSLHYLFQLQKNDPLILLPWHLQQKMILKIICINTTKLHYTLHVFIHFLHGNSLQNSTTPLRYRYSIITVSFWHGYGSVSVTVHVTSPVPYIDNTNGPAHTVYDNDNFWHPHCSCRRYSGMAWPRFYELR